jgi:hypothetical protein
MNLLINPGIRQGIMKLEDRMRWALKEELLPEHKCILTHHFAPGAYGREIYIPKGSLLVGKIHKHAHINVLSKGTVSVMTEDGPEEFSAPRTWVSTPGTKRVVYAHTDVIWTTIHVTEETDLVKIEDDVIAKSYTELDAFRTLAIKTEDTKCLG